MAFASIRPVLASFAMACYNITMTNKRAAGGGRKPRGPFVGNSAWLQARITEDLRARLEREAALNGRSLSQEAQVRLKGSFDLPAELQKAWGPPHIKDLAQLISSAVRSIEMAVNDDPLPERTGDWSWHRNPFTHATVCAAINAILAAYKPVGAMEVPLEVRKRAELLGPEYAEAQATPEGLALSIVRGLLEQLTWMEKPPTNPDAKAHYGAKHHVLPNIRNDLGEPKK